MAVPDIHENRKMLSLTSSDQIKIIAQVKPGHNSYGCLACCYSPEALWCCSALPCCKLPKNVIDTMEDSKYIYIRENSLEWNDPEITYAECKCCIPINPCSLRVVDHVQVLYFDSPTFEKIGNKTRCCNEARTYCCGGKGERIQIADQMCGGLCLVGRNGCPCCPVCLPECCTMPFTMQYNVHCEDAESARYEIKMARTNAKARMGLE